MKNEIKIKRIVIKSIDSPELLIVEDLNLSFEGSEEEMATYTLKVIEGLKNIMR